MNKKLLVVVDMQNDFVLPSGKLSISGADQIIRPMNEFLQKNKFDATILTFDTHLEDQYPNSEEGKMFPIHCVKGSFGWNLAIDEPENSTELPCLKLEKGVFDMWKENPNLGEINPKDWTVCIVGVASDYCVKYAVQGFLERNFRVEIIKDLTCGIQRQMDQVVMEDFSDYLKSGQLRII